MLDDCGKDKKGGFKTNSALAAKDWLHGTAGDVREDEVCDVRVCMMKKESEIVILVEKQKGEGVLK